MSAWGPMLMSTGVVALLGAAVIFRGSSRRTVLAGDDREGRPTSWDRISVLLVIYPVWSLVFGAVIWRGVPANAWDVRLAFERNWPVVEWAEWIYVTVYFVPLFLPWVVERRAHLRTFALDLWLLLGVSTVIYLLIPLVAWPRAFGPTTFAGQLLSWETRRADFGAASLPSFHVIWAILGARLLATRGRVGAMVGGMWAMAVAFACIATGAHAIADVLAAAGLCGVLVARRSPARKWIYAVAGRFLNTRLRMKPSPSPRATPPTP